MEQFDILMRHFVEKWGEFSKIEVKFQQGMTSGIVHYYTSYDGKRFSGNPPFNNLAELDALLRILAFSSDLNWKSVYDMMEEWRNR